MYMNTITMTLTFNEWLLALKDIRGRARIVARINSAEEGNFGDCAPVGEGVSEMRVHFGPGYRIYFAQEDKTVYCCLSAAIRKPRQRTYSGPKKFGTNSRRLSDD